MAQTDSDLKPLCTLGAVAALILLAYSLVTMVLMLAIGGQPATAQEAFSLLQDSRLVGLLRLDLLTILAMPLYYVLFLALYAALKKAHAAYAVLGVTLAFAGVTLILATPSALSCLALSDKYAAATSAEQKAMLLAAGEAVLASDMWHGSGAMMGAVLLETGALLVSLIMLWSTGFSRLTAYVGIVMHGLEVARIMIAFVLPEAGFMIMAVAGPLYLVWFPLLARDLFRLAPQVVGVSKSAA